MKKVNFKDGSVAVNIFQTALPMLAAQVLSLLYSIVDRIYIGRIPGLDSAALGAVGLCFPVIILISGFTNMYGMGGAPLFSIALGAGQTKRANEILSAAFNLLLFTALFLTLAGELGAPALLSLFGADSAVLPLSIAYLRVYLTGTVFFMISGGMNPFLTAQGFSLAGMASVAIGAGMNLLLDPLFIFVLHLGIPGAALATVLSQLLSFLYVMRFLLGKNNAFPLRFGLAGSTAREIISLGTAPFIMQATNSLVQIACNTVLSRYGLLYVSVMTIVSSVRSILDVPVSSLTEGTAPIISYNYGARRPGQVKTAIRIMTGLALAYTLLILLLILLRAGLFSGIFSGDSQLQMRSDRALHLYFAAFAFQALQYSGQTVFKALNKKKHAIFFSLLRKAVLVVPLTFLLPEIARLGPDGVFLAEPVSNLIGGLACFLTMRHVVWPELAAMEKEEKAKKLQ